MNLHEIFLQVLKITLSASVAAFIVMGIRLVFRKAPGALLCLLWLIVAVRLLVFSLPESQVSLIPKAISNGNAVMQAADYSPQEIVRIEAGDPVFWEIVEKQAAPLLRDGTGESYVRVDSKTGEVPKTFRETLLPVLSYIWAAGVLVMISFFAVSVIQVRKKTRLSVHMNRNIYYCDEPGTPFVYGCFRPKIYIPSGLTEEEQTFVLAHERAHIARGDSFWKLVGWLLICVHWFNPVLWISYMLLCRDIEKACDERILREQTQTDRFAYAYTLLKLSTKKYRISVWPVFFGEVGVKERIRTALYYKKPGKLAVAIMIAVSMIVAGCALTNPEASENAKTSSAFTDTEPSEISIKGKYDRFVTFAREGNAETDGWVVSFVYEDFKNREETREDFPRYQYVINNVRYWDDEPIEINSYFGLPYQYTFNTYRYRDSGFCKDTAGLEHDLTVIKEVLKEGTLPEELLSLDSQTITFEVLDKEQFFRLMRKALTQEIFEPERQKSFDTLMFTNYYREKEAVDGYVFRFACLKGWGSMDVVFIDIAYDGDGQVLLSDLVQQGKATAEQEKAYGLLRKIAENLQGREFDYAYGVENYKDTIIGGIDFGRLYQMTTRLTNNIYDEDYRLPAPEMPAESASLVE